MNKVFLIGNLTKDPENTQTATGISKTTFGLAVQRRFASQEGTPNVDFFNIICWRVIADNCAKYLKKGSKVAVVGSIQLRTYDAADGTKRYVTEIIGDEVEFLNSKNDGSELVPQQSASTPATPKKNKIEGLQPIEDSDLPF